LLEQEQTHASDIDASNTEHLCALSHLGDLLRRLLRLLDAAADDACVCAEVDEGPRLSAANGASSARNKDNPLG
jgi:hypothetical protein